MTLRPTSPFRSIAALLLLFAVLLGGASDAVACTLGESPAVQSLQSAETLPASKDSTDKAKQHALGAHGHCHSVAPLDLREAYAAEQLGANSLHFALAVISLSPAETTLVKEPPRA